MKRAFAVVFAVVASTVAAQDIDAPPAAFSPNEGIVRSVDRAAGEIIVRHGRLPEIDMPPMTMAFEVKHAGLLEGLKAGDRVALRVELLNGRFTITSIRRLP